MTSGHTLLLIRHGLAEERGEAWPHDSQRPLSAAGVQKLRRSRRGLARLALAPPDVILTSPLIRTRQTAEIVASAFDPHPPILALDALAPGGRAADVLSALEVHERRSCIILVGHQPDIGDLAAHLIGARRAIDFKKGAMCRIDVETLRPARSGSLRWLITPRILLSLSR